MRTPHRTIDGWFQSRVIMRRTFSTDCCLPVFAADVLPAGNLLEDQQAEPVASVEEPGRLRIVRGAHDVEVKLVLQDFGVALLRRAAKRIAGIGEGLVPIEPAQLQRPAVEAETRPP